VSPTKDRQRAAARARLEREMAARAAKARKRRQLQAGIGAGVAALLVIVGAVWLVTSLGGDDSPAPTAQASGSAAPAGCKWNPLVDPAVTPQPTPPATVRDVGTPPTSGEPRTGTQILNITTNLGVIKVKMDLTKAPCIASSFAHLSAKNLYNDTKCHRAFTGMLQCGDPSAKGKGWRTTDGTGGPAYRYADENLPVGQRPAYPRGTLAMANSGEATNGSQFFFILRDTDLDGPKYSVVGTIVEGLNILDDVDKAGNDGSGGQGTGHPKKEVVIKSVTLDPPQA